MKFDDIPDEVKERMGEIVHQLEGDAFFEPDENSYVVQHSADRKEVMCQHLNGWEGWALGWQLVFGQEGGGIFAPPEAIIVQALRAATKLLPPTD